MQTLLSLPRVVRSPRTAGSTLGQVLRYCRRGWIAAFLLAGIGSSAAQDIGITVKFTGTQPSPAATNQVHPLATQATPSQTAIVFGALPVATSTPGQLTATFTVSGYSGSFTPTAVAHYGIDYTLGAVSCSGSGTTETCTVPVQFVPTLPGGRKDALFLMNGTTRLATVLIYGVGTAPMALNQPGVSSVLYKDPTQYYYGSAVDENGILYVRQGNKIASVTKAGVLTVLPIILSGNPDQISIDGAGVLYIASSLFGSGLITYDTVQGIQGSLPVGTTNTYYTGTAVGGTGTVYAIDGSNNLIFKVKPDGTFTQFPISPTFLQPNWLALDSDEDLFIGGYKINELPFGGTQVNINSVGATDGLAVDAAKTVYATRYTGVNGVAELPASDYTTSQGSLDSGSPLGLSLGSDGTLYVGNYNQIDKVDRGQGKLDFGTQFPGNTYNNVTSTIYNGGNQPLVFSNVSLTGDGYQFVTLSGTNCATGTSIPPGATCSLGISFAPTHAGVLTGSLTVTTNSLNRTNSTQTTVLTATEYGPYLAPASNPLVFADQAITTSSGPVTETLTNQGNSFAGTLTSATSSNPAFTVDRTACTTAIPIGSSCPLTISFTPTAVTAYSATITLTYSSSNGGASLTSTFTVSGNGIAPPAAQAVLTSSTIAFPNQTINTTSSFQTVTLSNTGNATLNITGISLTGAGAANFAETTTCGTTLAANATCTISVNFTPTGTSTYSAGVSIADNATGSPQVISLSGTGIPAPAPLVVLAPTSISFPNQIVSTTSSSQSFTISNTGNAVLNISSIAVTGSGAANFAQTTTCASTLAAGATCSVSVTFTPSGTATYSAAITITDNAAGAPHAVPLNGTGIPAPAPVVSLSQASLTLANTVVGATSAAQNIALSNTGNAVLNITGITLTGTNPTSFAVGGNCGSTLAAGSSCNIAVTFTPTAVSALSASVTVTDNATGSPHKTTISGTGVAPPTPQAVLSPASLTFASTTVGVTSVAQSITLSNPGTAPLSITGISIGGTNAGSFASTNNCGASLAIAATCTINVTFTPSATGALSATLSVADNAAGSPQTASLSGTGSAADFALTVSNPTQAIPSSGGTAQYTISAAANSGSYSSPITFSISGLPTGVTAAFVPPTITPGSSQASTTLTITVASQSASLAPADSVPSHPWAHSSFLPISVCGVLCLFVRKRRNTFLKHTTRLLMFLAAVFVLASLSGCGGRPSVIQPGTYSFNVTGTSASGQHTIAITLIAQ